MVDRIESAVEMRQHHPVRRGMGRECRDIRSGAADVGLEVGGDQSRMGLDAIEDAGQQRLLQTAGAQPADRGYRDRNQQDHGDG